MTSTPAISTQPRRERRAYSVDFKAQIIRKHPVITVLRHRINSDLFV